MAQLIAILIFLQILSKKKKKRKKMELRTKFNCIYCLNLQVSMVLPSFFQFLQDVSIFFSSNGGVWTPAKSPLPKCWVWYLSAVCGTYLCPLISHSFILDVTDLKRKRKSSVRSWFSFDSKRKSKKFTEGLRHSYNLKFIQTLSVPPCWKPVKYSTKRLKVKISLTKGTKKQKL